MSTLKLMRYSISNQCRERNTGIMWSYLDIIYKLYEQLNSEHVVVFPSSEIQGQIVGARESLNGRKNKARKKGKNGEKSPWGQCLTRPVPNGHHRSGF